MQKVLFKGEIWIKDTTLYEAIVLEDFGSVTTMILEYIGDARPQLVFHAMDTENPRGAFVSYFTNFHNWTSQEAEGAYDWIRA